MNEKADEAALGTALVMASVVAYSTAGYFTRAIDLDASTMLLWRGLYAGLTLLAFVAWRSGWRTCQAFRIGRAGILVAVCSALATIAFINALRLASVADVLVISATAPFLTAALGWAWTGERTSPATLTASVVALAGVIVTMHGAEQAGHLLGDLLALVMALCLAIMMVVMRSRREVSMLPATCLSAFLCAALVLPVAAPGMPGGSQMLLLVLFGAAQFGLGLLLLTLGARLISAPRTALISSLDVPLAPLWVWLAFAELPSVAACAGGAMIMAAVAGEIICERFAAARRAG